MNHWVDDYLQPQDADDEHVPSRELVEPQEDPLQADNDARHLRQDKAAGKPVGGMSGQALRMRQNRFYAGVPKTLQPKRKKDAT